jgi:hypothetical protein
LQLHLHEQLDNEQQNAFIKKTSIMDGVMAWHEILDETKINDMEWLFSRENDLTSSI